MLKSRKYLVHAFIVCIISTVVLAKGNNENNNCLSTSTSDVQFFICNFCKNNILNYISNQDNEKLTTEMCSSSNMMDNSTIGEKIQLISSTIVTYGNLHGYYWNNATLTKLCLSHLVQYMPRRDTILMYGQLDVFLEYLFEHIL